MSNLTVTVIGVKRGSGISKKSGTPKPYSFCQVEYLKAAKGFSNDDHNIRVYGFQTATINATDSTELETALSKIPFLQPVDLILGADPENPQNNIVVGFTKAGSID